MTDPGAPTPPADDPFAADLALIADAAREGALIAMRHFRRDPKVWWKEGNSPVSEADYAVDAFLKETLLSARPDHGWLSEEMAAAEPPAAEPERFFVVDPIDGTRSFLRGEDTWCVAVSIVEKGTGLAAVIDAPARGEVLTATRGGPALLDGVTTRVSRPAEGARLRVAVPDSLLKLLPEPERDTLDLAPNVPSLAYRLALVASGRLDGTLIRPRANDWDIAAGDLILERAGGRLCDAAGAPRVYKLAGRRHGVLVAGAPGAMARLQAIAGGIG